MKLKKTAAFFAALCIGFSSLPSVFAESAAGGGRHDFALTFDNGGYTLMDGAEVKNDESQSSLTSDNALSLNGSGAYAVIENTDTINSIKDDFTISVCFKPDSNAPWARIFDIGTGLDKYIFLTQSASAKAGKPRFVIKTNGAEQVIESSREFVLGHWNHIAITRRSGLTTMYLNGAAAAQTRNITYSLADIGATTLNYLGKSLYSSDPYFKGMIDDFIVDSVAIDAQKAKSMAKEAYERELELIKEENFTSDAYLVIDTKAYNSDTGEKIETFSDSDSVAVITNVKNYRDTAAAVTAIFQMDGKERGQHTVTLDSGEEFEFTASFGGSEVSEYNILITDSIDQKTYDGGRLVKSDVVFPSPAPADSFTTTGGAHDPSIFKDPLSDYYYAYSTHNIIFRSKDLIHWEQRPVNSYISIPESCKTFIESNYADTTANGTYWAPDVIYAEGEEYPYRMYVSVSCGLGGRNSVIGLLAAKTAGFWLDGEVKDLGVVIASKEESGYPTNAIDPNIFTDTDGKKYFIWGSFWDGVRIAPLNDDGTVGGVDRSSDAALLSSSKTAGRQIYTTPRGVVGPEGPWLAYNPQSKYRYLFTSYGWLGSNYNVRIARMSDAKTLDTDISFYDYNGVNVGKTNNSAEQLWGYKLIGSYQLGDGITYVGQGHNSVLNDNGDWYLVDHCRKAVDSIAYLQVRKMLWTSDGWPVVSPLAYAGEKEQQIPRAMICGSWDLASVGHTIMQNGAAAYSSAAYKGSDLPVLSSKMIFEPDGSVSGDVGIWEYDGDHTVTVTFTKDGSEDNYEFYKNGDTMTLFVLVGYDRDKSEKALVMTGTDNRGITQFAKKSGLSAAYTVHYERKGAENTEQTILQKSIGSNPALGFDADGARFYGGDPAALVDGGSVYIYVGHDTAQNDAYVMPEWAVYSSTDMKNWKYNGVVMKATDISWRNDDNSAWAAQAVKHNGKYYLYFCTWDKTSDGKQSIGVAEADSPTGPFRDIGKPLVSGSVTVPETSAWNDIDPTVWSETDSGGKEHIYLAWGNGKYYLCELNEDMKSVKDINGDNKIDMNDIHEQTFTGMGGHGFTEAPWLYRRQNADGEYYGDYYTFFASDWREQISYAVSSDLSKNAWEYKGVIMPPTATSNTNHPSVIDFKGKTYFIYHNGSLDKGNGFRRSVCIEELNFNADGSIVPVNETSVGLAGSRFKITCQDRLLNYDDFVNSSNDNDYPISKALRFSFVPESGNTEWEIRAADDDPANVTIQAVNKPGLYLCVNGNNVILTQNADGKQKKNMTFKTVKGIGGKGGISFESTAKPGYFITSSAGKLILTNGGYGAACDFNVVQTHCAGYGQLSAEASNIIYDPESKTVSADIKTTNLSSSSFSFAEIAVLYSRDGSIKDIDVRYSANIAENGSVERKVTFSNAEEGDFFGYFVWDGISRNRPLCKNIRTQLQ